jgi:thiol-disulfide isomerase/thioredoxin
MKKILCGLIILVISIHTYAQQIPAVSAEQLIKYTSSKDTLYIINFWATWCPPCVQELPEFNEIKSKYKDAKVKVLLVSLDFKQDYPYKLARFVEKKQLTPEVLWMSDTDPNQFIPKIDDSWGGSIPATIMVHPGKGYRYFTEGSVTAREIGKLADRVLSESYKAGK